MPDGLVRERSTLSQEVYRFEVVLAQTAGIESSRHQLFVVFADLCRAPVGSKCGDVAIVRLGPGCLTL